MENNIKRKDDDIELITTEKRKPINNSAHERNKEIYEQAQGKSVKKIEMEYKPKKKKLNIRFLAGSLAVLLGVTSFISYVSSLVKNTVEEEITKYNVDKNIVQMIDSESNLGNIISYITYKLKDGTNNYAYNTEALARKIVNLDAKYIDLIIYNAYDNMQYNRTINMNELIKNLSNYTYGLESINPEVYYKLNGLYSFDDYLKDINCVDENGNVSLEKYNDYGKSLYKLHESALKNMEVNINNGKRI